MKIILVPRSLLVPRGWPEAIRPELGRKYPNRSDPIRSIKPTIQIYKALTVRLFRKWEEGRRNGEGEENRKETLDLELKRIWC